MEFDPGRLERRADAVRRFPAAASSACRRWPTTAGASAAWRPTTRKEDESGTYALHTLGENETIARLATGIKRFKLPDEFNSSRSTSKSPTEPKTGHRHRGARAPGPDLREPPAVSQGGRVLAAAAEGLSQRRREQPKQLAAATRPDRGQLGPLRAGHDAAGRQGRHGRVPLPQRQAGRVHGPRNQGREAAGRREGVPQVAAPSSSTGRRSTSATSATGSSQQEPEAVPRQAGGPVEHGRSSRAKTTSTSG